MENEVIGYTNQIQDSIKPILIIGLTVSVFIIFIGIILFFRKMKENKKHANKTYQLRQELEEMTKNG